MQFFQTERGGIYAHKCSDPLFNGKRRTPTSTEERQHMKVQLQNQRHLCFASLKCESGMEVGYFVFKVGHHKYTQIPNSCDQLPKMLGCKILCTCLNVKSFLYCKFGKKENKEIKKKLASMMPSTKVHYKCLMS